MSYILYSSIARAGGIDLYLGTEAHSHPPYHPRRRRRSGPGNLQRLRRSAGRGLIRLGQAFSSWGTKWAPTVCSSARPSLKLVP
ncbi:MAG: hypothetical protein RH942_03250 [Kiloniellaceae bacterium]